MNNMKRHFLWLVLLSVVGLLCVNYIDLLFTYIMSAQHWLDSLLGRFFSSSGWGQLARHAIGLIVIPLLIAFIPALIYRIFMKKEFAYFTCVLWLAWTVLLTLVVIK